MSFHRNIQQSPRARASKQAAPYNRCVYPHRFAFGNYCLRRIVIVIATLPYNFTPSTLTSRRNSLGQTHNISRSFTLSRRNAFKWSPRSVISRRNGMNPILDQASRAPIHRNFGSTRRYAPPACCARPMVHPDDVAFSSSDLASYIFLPSLLYFRLRSSFALSLPASFVTKQYLISFFYPVTQWRCARHAQSPSLLFFTCFEFSRFSHFKISRNLCHFSLCARALTTSHCTLFSAPKGVSGRGAKRRTLRPWPSWCRTFCHLYYNFGTRQRSRIHAYTHTICG